MGTVAKYHHKIPQTYLKPWCHNTQSIWVYQDGKKQERNIEKVFGENYYHAIKAGSLYTNSRALKYIFGFLWKYIIMYDGKIIWGKEKLNQKFYDFDNWDIRTWMGRTLTRKEKNEIKAKLSQTVYNKIEEEWCRQYENDWAKLILEIDDVLKRFQSGESITLTTNARETILKYFVMFDWRGEHGNQDVNSLFDKLFEGIPEIKIPRTERVYAGDETLVNEQKHALYIRMFDQFLHGTGAMYEEYLAYSKRCTLLFWVAPKGTFITSNNPCYRFTNELGQVMPTFIALPSLAMTIVRKDDDEPNGYRVVSLNNRQVDYFNWQTMSQSSRIILKDGNIIPSDVGYIFEERDGKIELIP